MSYQAQDIEVLSGLDPVKRRPGMYTDTTRPNHLVQEVVDNSVDEALAGYANRIDVTLSTDGSVSVATTAAVCRLICILRRESWRRVILTKLHAGGKFQKETTSFLVASTGWGLGCQRSFDFG